LQEPEREALKLLEDATRSCNNIDEQRALDALMRGVQPAQEPVAREWNFCERCGKRTKDLTVIHTCTPPQEGK